MAKKDKTNSTPIEFQIPPADLGGKGSRVPIPINQPNWKYKTNSNSHRFQSGIARAFLVIAIALSILLITNRLYTSPLWIAVIVFGIIAFITAPSATASTFNKTQVNEEDQNIVSQKKRKKKQPKHRKDYR